MKRSKGIVVIVALCVVGIALASCHTSRTAVGGIKPMTAKVQYTLTTSKDKQSLGGSLYIIPNTFIQLSAVVPILGTEAVRVQITQDSIILLDRLNRMYVAEPLTNLTQIVGKPTTLSDVQALFLNGTAEPVNDYTLRNTASLQYGSMGIDMQIATTKPSRKERKQPPVLNLSRSYEQVPLSIVVLLLQTLATPQ